MPENKPIPDAELAEVKRLHAAATPGEWRMFYGGEPLLIGSSGERVADMEYPRDAEAVTALRNAFGPLIARLEAAEREQQRVHELANRLLDANNGLIDTIRKLDPEALCDWHDSIGGDEYLQRWLAARDAQQRNDGAAKGIEQAREMLSMAESGEEADEMMRAAAKRLREGGE